MTSSQFHLSLSPLCFKQQKFNVEAVLKQVTDSLSSLQLVLFLLNSNSCKTANIHPGSLKDVCCLVTAFKTLLSDWCRHSVGSLLVAQRVSMMEITRIDPLRISVS